MLNSLRFRIIGLCILAAFPLFGIGQALLDGELHQLGLLMCFSNSAAVISSANGFETTSMTLLLPGAVFEVIFGVLLIAQVRSKQV